jgi:hypothetical protein
MAPRETVYLRLELIRRGREHTFDLPRSLNSSPVHQFVASISACLSERGVALLTLLMTFRRSCILFSRFSYHFFDFLAYSHVSLRCVHVIAVQTRYSMLSRGVKTKRKRVFGRFRTGNVLATLHLSQKSCTCKVGTGVKWLVYYPFGNIRTLFSSSSSHPHLLPRYGLSSPLSLLSSPSTCLAGNVPRGSPSQSPM